MTAIVLATSELESFHPLFAGLPELFGMFKDPSRAAEFAGAELHPGAARAYRELGLLE